VPLSALQITTCGDNLRLLRMELRSAASTADFVSVGVNSVPLVAPLVPADSIMVSYTVHATGIGRILSNVLQGGRVIGAVMNFVAPAASIVWNNSAALPLSEIRLASLGAPQQVSLQVETLQNFNSTNSLIPPGPFGPTRRSVNFSDTIGTPALRLLSNCSFEVRGAGLLRATFYDRQSGLVNATTWRVTSPFTVLTWSNSRNVSVFRVEVAVLDGSIDQTVVHAIFTPVQGTHTSKHGLRGC